jgi:chaperonin GroEL
MPRPTKTLLGDKAHEAIFRGVNAVYEPTRRTFGPEGKNALLFNTFGRGPRITNDGVTVGGSQLPKDPHIRLVSELFLEACKKTNEKVGDGTTGTVIIAGALYNKIHSIQKKSGGGMVDRAESKGVMTMKREILATTEKVKKAIREAAHKTETIEELINVATISTESPEIGKLVADMAWEVGVNGFIDVVEGYKGEIETDIIKGMRFPAKIASKGFLNNPDKYEMLALDCKVLLTDYSIDNVLELKSAIGPMLEKFKKLVVIAPFFSDDVLTAMWKTMYDVKGDGKIMATGLEIYPVKVPSLRSEQFEDIAIGLGAKFFKKELGVSFTQIQESELGFVEKLVVKDVEAKEDALAIGKKDVDKVAERIEILKSQILETREPRFKMLLERRIASLDSAVGVIRVGASTDADARYMKLKIEDGVFACKAALKEGYVPGAGLCLKTIAETLPDSDLLKEALLAPYRQIIQTLGEDYEIGPEVVDPTDSIYYAVEHAVGVVANLATVDMITAELEDPLLGEGQYAIARAINAMVVHEKVKSGRLQENQSEMELENLSGMNVDEHSYFDNQFLPQQ